MAAALLKKMGFPSALILQGLSRAFEALHTAKSKIARSADAAAIRGTVIEFGRTIEFPLPYKQNHVRDARLPEIHRFKSIIFNSN